MEIGLGGEKEVISVVRRLKEEKQSIIKQFISSQLSNTEYNSNVKSGLKSVLTSRFVSKQYKDNSEYKGEISIEGTRNGIGIMKFSNGHVYVGEWSNDLFNGKGTYFFDNGERYEGQLKGGRKQGKGTYYYANGNVYVGHSLVLI